MRIEIELFGALRAMEPEGIVHLTIRDGACIADLRRVLETHALQGWARYQPGTLQRCTFADDTALLRDRDPVPPHGRIAVLMPVSGG